MKKSVLSLFLGLVLCLQIFAVAVFPAKALSEGDFEYVINASERVFITSYIGSASEVEVPSTIAGLPVTRINDSAFLDCAFITSVTLPESITYLDSSAFRNCSAMETIELSENITFINSDAFYNCAALKSIDLPGNLVNIADGAFANCCSLESITLPASMEWVYQRTFSGCTSLKSVIFEGEVKLIEMYAFHNCTSLTSIDLSHAETIEWGAFENCSSLSEVDLSAATNIGGSAFNSSGLVTLDLPAITSLGSYAFFGCQSLTSVKLGNDLKTIADGAFCVCCLSSILLPENLETIGSFAFTGEISGEFSLPQTLLTLNENALSDLIVGSVHIPASVTEIGTNALPNFSSLTVAEENEFFSATDSMLFNKDGTSLLYLKDINRQEYIIPEGTLTIESNAVSITAKSTLILPESLKTIKRDAIALFADELLIPANVTVIEDGAFSKNNITAFKVDEENTDFSAVDGVLFNKDASALLQYPFNKSDASYTIPSTVTTIASGAFSGYYEGAELQYIFIPASVSVIGETAFSRSELTHIFYAGNESDWPGLKEEASFSPALHFNSTASAIAEKTTATCGANGTKTLYCSICNTDLETLSDPATGEHSWDNDCDSVCNGCPLQRATSHSYGDFIYQNDASPEHDGSLLRTCSVCFAEDSIPAEGSKKSAVTDEAIESIGVISITKKNTIEHARALYDALNSNQKNYVKNLPALIEAERKFAALGDVNQDQSVSVADIVLTLRIIAYDTASDRINYEAANLDGDQTITTADAILIARMILDS